MLENPESPAFWDLGIWGTWDSPRTLLACIEMTTHGGDRCSAPASQTASQQPRGPKLHGLPNAHTHAFYHSSIHPLTHVLEHVLTDAPSRISGKGDVEASWHLPETLNTNPR